MPNNSIAADVVQFLAAHIHSIEQLEILCLFAENPARTWTVAEVFRNIQSTDKSVSDCIQHFIAAGAVASAGAAAFCFRPKTPELEQLIRQVVRSYRERRVKIIEMIYKRPSTSVQDFAAAFQLRKEK